MRDEKHGGTSLSKCIVTAGELVFLIPEYRLLCGTLPETTKSVLLGKL